MKEEQKGVQGSSCITTETVREDGAAINRGSSGPGDIEVSQVNHRKNTSGRTHEQRAKKKDSVVVLCNGLSSERQK
jgi:hypothetical protein